MTEQKNYTMALNALSHYILSEDYNTTKEQRLRENEREDYQKFIDALQEKIIEQEAIQGEVV